ncbi:MAG TPA: PKD domain-containing protein [Daejeonella sp.]
MKKAVTIFLYLFCASGIIRAQQIPANDNCGNARQINALKYCSLGGEFTNAGATESFIGNGADVWFKFIAVAFEISINVTGHTLQSPRIGMMTDCGGTGIVGSIIVDGNTTIFTKGGLTPGQVYYIWVSGANNNTGTFDLCTKNYNPPTQPGQDFSSASLLCSTASFPVINVTGAGTNNREAAGTCMENPLNESNTAWYRWTAANNGSLVFTITPTNFDDIDWALYDLGPEGNTQVPSGQNVIRCAAGHGIDNSDCPDELLYTKTGLDFNAVDSTETGGCGKSQDGIVKFVEMKQGHVYALIIDNFTRGHNGFTLDFTDQHGKAGTAEFVGPKVPITMVRDKPCTIDQNYTFTTNATNYTSLKWFFGEGASIASSGDLNPPAISYSSAGQKTVVLQATSDRGCSVTSSISFVVGLKPDLPVISGLKPRYCIGESITLSTPRQAGATYSWTGPAAFTSDQPDITIPVNNAGKAGRYSLTITINECTSDPASVIIPPIGQTPVASFTSSIANPCTVQQTYTFTNTSLNYQKIKWNFGEGATVLPGGSNEVYTISYMTQGVKTIILEAEGNSGCVSTLSQTITVSQSFAQPVISVNNNSVFCLNDTIRLSTPVQSDATYRWTGPNNFSSDQRVIEIPVTSVAVAGTYSVILQRGSCSTQAVSVIIPAIFDNPIAEFRAEPSLPAKLSFPIKIRFFNESVDADTYLWDFGDGQTSTDTNPEHTYLEKGNFDVTLTAFKGNVCSASVVKGTFTINESGAIFIPNIFTPNNDAVNDQFVVNMSNIKTYRIQIFNRYGLLMYSSENLLQSWDGTYQNQAVPVGTYYYVLDAVDFDNNVIKKSGSVTILR